MHDSTEMVYHNNTFIQVHLQFCFLIKTEEKTNDSHVINDEPLAVNYDDFSTPYSYLKYLWVKNKYPTSQDQNITALA